jgi:hypothetical protein
VKPGFLRARAQGNALSRPPIDAKTEVAIRKALQKDERHFGVATVQRVKAALRA